MSIVHCKLSIEYRALSTAKGMIVNMPVRAVRGATTVKENTREDIIASTTELLNEIVGRNELLIDDIISVIFSSTADLDSAFPAAAAREMGWKYVPLMCTNEINVSGSLKKCIRVLMHINTDKKPENIKHVYLHGAKVLRPDLAGE